MCLPFILQVLVQGIGKDMVAARVVSDPRIANHSELSYQVLLQGNSDDVFLQKSNDKSGWLLVIEDATSNV